MTNPHGVIDPMDGPALAFAGRIVTMNAARSVIKDGVVYIAKGAIVAVQERNKQAPSGFDAGQVIETSGTIFPGLIELHNHVVYNALPLWRVPGTFTDRNKWAGLAEKRKRVTAPMAVLAGTPDILPAVARYVECKCLFGGTTTTQGFRLNNAGGQVRYYRGLVRNVEQTGDPALPIAGGQIPDVAKKDASQFLQKLESKKWPCYFLHLSEGTDEATRKHFTDLELPNGWAITSILAGIHATALQPKDLHVLRQKGAAVVWSPLSNLVLYGDTMRIKSARSEQLRIGLGSDWSVSGSKNLLGELKVARLVGADLDAGFSDADLVAMVTSEAAKILHWDAVLGSLEAGKRADFLVVKIADQDPYGGLLDARETDIQLVVINGVPRLGTATLMKKAGFEDTEKVSIGSAERRLHLEQKDVDAAVGKITFDAAHDTLKDALHDLPELAKKVDAKRHGAVAVDQEQWHIALDEMAIGDFESGTDPAAEGALGQLSALGLGAQTLQSLVSPIVLDPATVADDSNFFDTIDQQLNLPSYLKTGLRQAYA